MYSNPLHLIMKTHHDLFMIFIYCYVTQLVLSSAQSVSIKTILILLIFKDVSS